MPDIKNDDRLDGGGDEVKRFYLRTNPINGVSYMAPRTGEPSGGEFVKYEDHAALRQRCAALQSERDALAARVAQLEHDLREANGRADAHEKLAESCFNDAGRYRWLREQKAHCRGHVSVNWNIGDDWIDLNGDQLDAAIDEAIAAEEGKSP